MAYTIYRANGTAVTIADNAISTEFYSPNLNGAGKGVGTRLVGRNAIGYGESIAQNFLQLTENFAGANPPSDSTSLEGQLWWDTVRHRLRVNISSVPGTTDWGYVAVSGISMDASFFDLIAEHTFRTPVITTGNASTPGTLIGAWTLGAGSTLSGAGIVPPIASGVTLGGIKVGSGLSIDGSGVLSATATSYTLPNASSVTLGGVRVGSGLSIDGSGILSATGYTLPTASSGVIGGVRVGSGLSIDGSGILSVVGGATGTVTSVGVSVSQGVTTSGGPITTSGSISIGLGDITPTSVITPGVVLGSNLSGTNTGDQIISLTGDVTGTGNGTFITALAASGVTAGSYTNANITVDAKGRITSASSGTNGTVTSVAVSGGSTGLTTSGGPVTTSGTITLGGTLAIANGGTGQTTASGAINALLPSQAGNANKSLVTNGTTASWQNLSSLNNFETEVPFPTSVPYVSVLHGLGGRPRFTSYSLKCVVATSDYAVGDEIPFEFSRSEGIYIFNPWVNATTMGFSFSSLSNSHLLAPKAGGALFPLVPSEWNVVMRAQGLSTII